MTQLAILERPLAHVNTQVDAPRVSHCPHAPHIKAVLKRVGVTLWLACVMPAAVFTFVLFRFGVTPALVAALLWSYGAIGWQLATRRRRSGLLVLAASVMTLKTLIALASGNTFLYFLQPVATDFMLGAAFILSLATTRPIVARMAGDFYPMNDDLAQRPRIRQLFKRLTLLWGTLCVAKACITLWLLQSQSLHTFVVVKSASVLSINALAILVTVGAAVLVARHEGLMHTADAPA